MIKKRANTHSTIKLKSLDRQPNPTEKEAAQSHGRYAHGMTQPRRICSSPMKYLLSAIGRAVLNFFC